MTFLRRKRGSKSHQSIHIMIQEVTYQDIFNKEIICDSIYRLGHDILSDYRRNILNINREAIKEAILLRFTPILNRLHDYGVITLQEKEIIEVRM